jgi:hypothetical protein
MLLNLISIVVMVGAIPQFSEEDRLRLRKTMAELASAGEKKFISAIMAGKTAADMYLTLPQTPMNNINPTVQPAINNNPASSQLVKSSTSNLAAANELNNAPYSGQKFISPDEILELRKTIAQLAAQGGKGKFDPSAAKAGGDPRFSTDSVPKHGMSGYPLYYIPEK